MPFFLNLKCWLLSLDSMCCTRVFIKEFNDLIPKWMGFVKGIVDSDDMPLNISRESLPQRESLATVLKCSECFFVSHEMDWRIAFRGDAAAECNPETWLKMLSMRKAPVSSNFSAWLLWSLEVSLWTHILSPLATKETYQDWPPEEHFQYVSRNVSGEWLKIYEHLELHELHRLGFLKDKERFKSFQEAFSQCLKLGVYEAFWCSMSLRVIHSTVALLHCYISLSLCNVQHIIDMSGDLTSKGDFFYFPKMCHCHHCLFGRIMPTGSKSSLCFATIPPSLGRLGWLTSCDWHPVVGFTDSQDLVGLDEYISRMKPGATLSQNLIDDWQRQWCWWDDVYWCVNCLMVKQFNVGVEWFNVFKYEEF